MLLDGDVGFSRYAAEHREGLVAIHFDCLGLLVVVAGPRDRPVVRDTLLVIHSVVSFSASSECVDFSLVLRRVGLLEVARQFISARVR